MSNCGAMYDCYSMISVEPVARMKQS